MKKILIIAICLTTLMTYVKIANAANNITNTKMPGTTIYNPIPSSNSARLNGISFNAVSKSKNILLARSGCCSWHGGVCGCDYATNRIRCCDGTLSPSCTCN